MSIRNLLKSRHLCAFGLFAAAAVFIGLVFPHAHIVDPATHDSATCQLCVMVMAGALLLPAVAVLILLFRPLASRKRWRPAPVFDPVVLPFSARAPPIS